MIALGAVNELSAAFFLRTESKGRGVSRTEWSGVEWGSEARADGERAGGRWIEEGERDREIEFSFDRVQRERDERSRAHLTGSSSSGSSSSLISVSYPALDAARAAAALRSACRRAISSSSSAGGAMTTNDERRALRSNDSLPRAAKGADRSRSPRLLSRGPKRASVRLEERARAVSSSPRRASRARSLLTDDAGVEPSTLTRPGREFARRGQILGSERLGSIPSATPRRARTRRARLAKRDRGGRDAILAARRARSRAREEEENPGRAGARRRKAARGGERGADDRSGEGGKRYINFDDARPVVVAAAAAAAAMAIYVKAFSLVLKTASKPLAKKVKEITIQSPTVREFMIRTALRVDRLNQARTIITPVPVRPRRRGERDSLRTFAVVSLRPRHGFNPDTPRRLSTPPLTPFNFTPTYVASRGATLVSRSCPRWTRRRRCLPAAAE